MTGKSTTAATSRTCTRDARWPKRPRAFAFSLASGARRVGAPRRVPLAKAAVGQHERLAAVDVGVEVFVEAFRRLPIDVRLLAGRRASLPVRELRSLRDGIERAGESLCVHEKG